MTNVTQSSIRQLESKEQIFLVGAGGHAKVVADLVERQGLYTIAFLTDSNSALKGSFVYGYTVFGKEAELIEVPEVERVSSCIVAIGSNQLRASIARWLTAQSFRLVTAVHPSAQIGRGTSLGKGTVVMAGAVINSDCRIGDNVIVNTKASIDHDCVIGDGVHVAPGATICGGVAVGAGAFICAGSTILPNVTIGKNAIIGAGATVIADVPDSVTVVGSPARPLKKV